MQKEPTYSFKEFTEQVKICDENTLLILIELLAEEAKLYTRTEAEYLYMNIHNAVHRFNNFRRLEFFKLFKK